MEQVAIVSFKDVYQGDAIAIVGQDERNIALGLSIMQDGDIEVIMKRDDARRLVAVLEQALMLSK